MHSLFAPTYFSHIYLLHIRIIFLFYILTLTFTFSFLFIFVYFYILFYFSLVCYIIYLYLLLHFFMFFRNILDEPLTSKKINYSLEFRVLHRGQSMRHLDRFISEDSSYTYYSANSLFHLFICSRDLNLNCNWWE